MKMTPNNVDGTETTEYNLTGESYITTEISMPSARQSYVKDIVLVPQRGLFISSVGGSSSTYYCDTFWSGPYNPYWGGSSDYGGLGCGVFSLAFDWQFSASLPYALICLSYK